jgi:hypothetical protein
MSVSLREKIWGKSVIFVKDFFVGSEHARKRVAIPAIAAAGKFLPIRIFAFATIVKRRCPKTKNKLVPNAAEKR